MYTSWCSQWSWIWFQCWCHCNSLQWYGSFFFSSHIFFIAVYCTRRYTIIFKLDGLLFTFHTVRYVHGGNPIVSLSLSILAIDWWCFIFSFDCVVEFNIGLVTCHVLTKSICVVVWLCFTGVSVQRNVETPYKKDDLRAGIVRPPAAVVPKGMFVLVLFIIRRCTPTLLPRLDLLLSSSHASMLWLLFHYRRSY